MTGSDSRSHPLLLAPLPGFCAQVIDERESPAERSGRVYANPSRKGSMCSARRLGRVGFSGGIKMAPQVGLEPTTLRLTAECSAIELLRNGWAAEHTSLITERATAVKHETCRVPL